MIKHKLNYNSPTCMYSSIATDILLYTKKKTTSGINNDIRGKMKGYLF